MAVGYFIANYARRAHPIRIIRYCPVDDLTANVQANGGDWREVEVLGNRCLVKVRASGATLSAITALPGVRRLPCTSLSDPLTAAQQTTIRNEMIDAGYTAAEADAVLTDATWGQALRRLAARRRRVRYDEATDTIVCDGEAIPCVPIDMIEAAG